MRRSLSTLFRQRRVLISLGVIGAVTLLGGLGYLEFARSRDMAALKQQVGVIEQAGRGTSALTAASVDHAVMNGDVYLTAAIDDQTISSGTIIDGQVIDEVLSDETKVRMPNGAIVLAADIQNGATTSWTLADGTVTRAKIVNSAVTTLKLADGSVTEVKIRNGAIKSKKIAAGQVQAVHLASGSVLSAKLANSAVTNPKIADTSVTTRKLADQSVTALKIAVDGVENQNLADGSVDDSNLVDGSVTTPKIANGAVTTPKLGDSAVTNAKIANLAVTAAKIATGTITGSQIASDGTVVKSIVGNSIVSVTNNANGSYSIALTTSCSEGQILKFSSGQWQCGTDIDLGYYTPQDILRFPYVGTQKTDWFDGSAEATALHGGTTPNYLLYLGAGQNGVVRQIFSVGNNNLVDWTDMDDYELRIYTGAGDLTALQRANPPSQYLDAKIPLGILLGAVYNTNKPANQPIETAILDYSRSQDAVMTFNLPIPFENGILIQFWKISPEAVNTSLGAYHWVSYETGTTSFPYQSWRLKASALHHTTVNDENGATFMDVSGKAGMLLGLYSSIKSVAGLGEDFNEENWTFYPDGETNPVWQVSGTEDMFGLNPYYYSAGVQTHMNWGTTFIDTPAYESYRLFVRDPLIWQNSLRGFYPTTGESTLDLNILTLYYAAK